MKQEILRLKARTSEIKDFTIWSDVGEATKHSISDLVNLHGGKMYHSCAYTPETMAVIERLWRTMTEMSSVMLLSSGLSEPFWEDATRYEALLYNRTLRATGTPNERKAPCELYDGVEPSMDKCQPFGCRAYAHIPKAVRRKNHKGRAEMCIFVGLQEDMSPGYKLYRPLYRDYIVSGHVKFAPMLQYDVKIGGEKKVDDNTPTGELKDYQYLVGMLYLDPDDGLVYKTTSVRVERFQGQQLIVATRSSVPLAGEEIPDKNTYHVRDIEEMTNNSTELQLETMGYSQPPLDWYNSDDSGTENDMNVVRNDSLELMVDTQDFERQPEVNAEEVTISENAPSSGKKRRAAAEDTRKKARKSAVKEPSPAVIREGVRMESQNGFHRRVRTAPKRLVYHVEHGLSRYESAAECGLLRASVPSKGNENEVKLVADEFINYSMLQVLYGGGLAAYALTCNMEVPEVSDPSTRDEALASPQHGHWLEAEVNELKSLSDNCMVGRLEELPPGKKRVKFK